MKFYVFVTPPFYKQLKTIVFILIKDVQQKTLFLINSVCGYKGGCLDFEDIGRCIQHRRIHGCYI